MEAALDGSAPAPAEAPVEINNKLIEDYIAKHYPQYEDEENEYLRNNINVLNDILKAEAVQKLIKDLFNTEVNVESKGEPPEQTNITAASIFENEANPENVKLFYKILSNLIEQYYNNNQREIIYANYKISYNTGVYTITIDLTFAQKIEDMCSDLCAKLKDTNGKYLGLQDIDDALTLAAKAYIAMKSSVTVQSCGGFKDAFEYFNNLLNEKVQPNTIEARISTSTSSRKEALIAKAGTGGPGAEAGTGGPGEDAAAGEGLLEAEAEAATPAARTGAPGAAEDAAAAAEAEAAAAAEASGGKRKVKKGGANVGGLNEIYNARDLVKDDHPPAEIVGSADQNMAQYSPASFSAGSMLSQDMAQGIAMPSQELLNPLSSQQVGGAKKKVLKKKKRSDSPKKSKK